MLEALTPLAICSLLFLLPVPAGAMLSRSAGVLGPCRFSGVPGGSRGGKMQLQVVSLAWSACWKAEEEQAAGKGLCCLPSALPPELSRS